MNENIIFFFLFPDGMKLEKLGDDVRKNTKAESFTIPETSFSSVLFTIICKYTVLENRTKWHTFYLSLCIFLSLGCGELMDLHSFLPFIQFLYNLITIFTCFSKLQCLVSVKFTKPFPSPLRVPQMPGVNSVFRVHSVFITSSFVTCSIVIFAICWYLWDEIL